MSSRNDNRKRDRSRERSDRDRDRDRDRRGGGGRGGYHGGSSRRSRSRSPPRRGGERDRRGTIYKKLLHLSPIQRIALSSDYGRDDRRDRDLKRDDRDRRDHDSRDKRYPGRGEHGRERNGEPARDRVERRDRDGDREHDIPPPRRDTDRERAHTTERGDSLPPSSAPGNISNGRHQDDHGHEREEGEEGEDAPMEDAVDDDEAAMRAMMGFGGFDTTKVRSRFYFIPIPA